jgi:hypothetical protein
VDSTWDRSVKWHAAGISNRVKNANKNINANTNVAFGGYQAAAAA